MSLWMLVFWLLIGFLLLVKGADFFVNGSVGLAKRYKLSELFIGLTVVAFGTSVPELFVNIQSALHGHTDMALGNVVGSNIANIALILGLGILFGKLLLYKGTYKNILVSLLFAVLLVVLLLLGKTGDASQLFFWSGLVLLCTFAGYFWYAYRHSSLTEEIEYPNPSKHIWTILIMIVGGLLAIIVGGELVVQNAIKIAEFFGVSNRVIGLTIVAVGTSLPELMTTVVSIRKGRVALGVGNIIGSNIFNIGLIGGFTAIVHPISVSNAVYYDIVVLLTITVFFFLCAIFTKNHLKKWQGVVLLLVYIVYILSLLFW